MDEDLKPRQSVVSARETGVQKPTGARASVFDVPRKKAPRFDPKTLPIKSGVPIPPAEHGRRADSRYRLLLNRMAPGDCVELPTSQACALVKYALQLKVKVTRRRLNETTSGVWRLE